MVFKKNNQTIASYENILAISLESIKKNKEEITNIRKILLKTTDNNDLNV